MTSFFFKKKGIFMIEITKINMGPNARRLGQIHVKYFDIILKLEVCLYKDEKLWVRMPEIWINASTRKRYTYFDNPDKSQEFQNQVLSQFIEKTGLNLESAIEMRKSGMKKRDKITQNT